MPLSRRLSSLVVALAAILVVPGPVSAQQADVPAVVVTCEQLAETPAQTAVVTVDQGQGFTVTLCSNPSTGFTWLEPVSSDDAVALLTGTNVAPAPSPMPGAPGTQGFAFDAPASGAATVTFAYARPFASAEFGDWSLVLNVTVRDDGTPVDATAAPVPGLAVEVGCDRFAGGEPVVVHVDAVVGDPLTLSLCSDPTSGYRWTVTPDETGVAAITGLRFAPVVAGDEGRDIVDLTIGTAGRAIVSASYDQPFAGGEVGARRLELTIDAVGGVPASAVPTATPSDAPTPAPTKRPRRTPRPTVRPTPKPRPASVGQWRVSPVTTDALSGQPTATAILEATSGRSPFDDAFLLVLRCKDGATDLYVDWQQFVDTEAHEVRFRIGNAAMRSERWNVSTSYEATFVPDPQVGEIIGSLLGQSRLVIEVTPYGASPARAIFDIRGFDNAIAGVRSACGW